MQIDLDAISVGRWKLEEVPRWACGVGSEWFQPTRVLTVRLTADMKALDRQRFSGVPVQELSARRGGGQRTTERVKMNLRPDQIQRDRSNKRDSPEPAYELQRATFLGS